MLRAMELLALFTPEDDDAQTWRVRLFPSQLPLTVPGLNQDGEYEGVVNLRTALSLRPTHVATPSGLQQAASSERGDG